MQHGPLQNFYFNQRYGNALVRYNTKEEASKAQKSLNACSLSGASILAEFITESEFVRMADTSQTSAVASSAGLVSSSGGSPWLSAGPPRSAPYNKADGSSWNGAATNNVWGGSSGSLWSLPDERGGALLPGDLLGGH